MAQVGEGPVTVSGVDPARVLGLVKELVALKNQMTSIFGEIRTTDMGTIRGSYEGQAATALMTQTEKLMGECEEALETIMKTIDTKFQQDLDDIKNTDKNLA